MANESIELAKNWDPKQAAKHLPAYAQVKYDGVPLRFIKQPDGRVIAYTRQNEEAVSVPHLVYAAEQLISRVGGSVTAEVFLPGKPFKDSSGAVRRQAANLDLFGVIFDADIHNRPSDPYSLRMQDLRAAHYGWRSQDSNGKLIPVRDLFYCATIDDVEDAWEFIMAQLPNTDLEGMMLHRTDKPFQPGKRCWGLGRYKPQPTIDLAVVSFEEATSEAGEPLGMLGRVNVRLTRVWPSTPPAGWAKCPETADTYFKVVGVGPGKLTHTERTAWWEDYKNGRDVTRLFVEIKYMPDPTYEALRQPTIQRFRLDKAEGDTLVY